MGKSLIPQNVTAARGELVKMENLFPEIKTFQEADKQSHILDALKRFFDSIEDFDMAFNAALAVIRRDMKKLDILEEMRKSGLPYKKIAEMTNISSDGAVKTLFLELKKAYRWTESEMKAIEKKLYGNRQYPTRKLFINGGMLSKTSGDQEWYTPRWIYERARHIMGSIDLDPATSKKAIQLGNKPTQYFTKEDDGLSKDWEDYQVDDRLNVFINPPYTIKPGRKMGKRVTTSGADLFICKFLLCGVKDLRGIIFTREDSTTHYSHILMRQCFIFHPDKRIKFMSGRGLKGFSSYDSHVVWGFNVDPAKFYLAFSMGSKKGGNNFGTVTSTFPINLCSEAMRRSKELAPWISKLLDLPRPF